MKGATREKYLNQLQLGKDKLQALAAVIPGDAVELKDQWQLCWGRTSELTKMVLDPLTDVMEASNKLKVFRHSIIVLESKINGTEGPRPLIPTDSPEDLIASLPENSLHRELLDSLGMAQAYLMKVYNKTIEANELACMVPVVMEVRTTANRITPLMQEFSKLRGIK